MKGDLVCAILIAFCTVANVYVVISRWGRKDLAFKSFTFEGDDYPEHVPLVDKTDISPRKTTFDIHPDQFPISGPNATEVWQSIYPPGYGFVRMGPDASIPRLLCVAMFHQLHCVEKMRIFLDNPNDTHVGFAHQQHCMNYLRQLFLCRVDLTLEPIAMPLGEDDLPMDEKRVLELDDLAMRSGLGVERTCRDWNTLYDITGSNFLKWHETWPIPSPFETDIEQSHHA